MLSANTSRALKGSHSPFREPAGGLGASPSFLPSLSAEIYGQMTNAVKRRQGKMIVSAGAKLGRRRYCSLTKSNRPPVVRPSLSLSNARAMIKELTLALTSCRINSLVSKKVCMWRISSAPLGLPFPHAISRGHFIPHAANCKYPSCIFLSAGVHQRQSQAKMSCNILLQQE